MKKIAEVMCLLLILATNIHAQKIIPNDTFDLGHRCYAFSLSYDGEKALVFFNDSVSTNKQKSKVGLYDLGKHSFLWTDDCPNKERITPVSASGYQLMRHHPANESQVTSYGSLLVEKGHCRMISNTGNKLWDIKLMPVLIDNRHNVLLGYSSGSSNKLHAYRLSDGQQQWEQKIVHDKCWGWDEVYLANDSLVIIPANELYFLNPINGNLKIYDSRNGFQRTGNMFLKAFAVGMVGGVLGAVIGSVPYYTYKDVSPLFSDDVVTKTCSNIFCMNGKYYFSDRDKLSCIDDEGNALWSHEFPSKTMGRATVTGDGRRVTVINYAFGLVGGYQSRPCGKPFVASFDAETGKQLYCSSLSDDKENVCGAFVDKDYAYMIFPDRLAYQQLDDSTINIKNWNTDAYGNLSAIPDDTIYTYRLNDLDLTPLYCDSTHFIVITDTDKMKVVDTSLKITDDYQADNVYFKIGEADSLALVTNDDGDGLGQYLIIKDNGQLVGRFNKKVTSFAMHGDNAYILSDNEILKIDFKHIQTLPK